MNQEDRNALVSHCCNTPVITVMAADNLDKEYICTGCDEKCDVRRRLY